MLSLRNAALVCRLRVGEPSSRPTCLVTETQCVHCAARPPLLQCPLPKNSAMRRVAARCSSPRHRRRLRSSGAIFLEKGCPGGYCLLPLCTYAPRLLRARARESRGEKRNAGGCSGRAGALRCHARLARGTPVLGHLWATRTEPGKDQEDPGRRVRPKRPWRVWRACLKQTFFFCLSPMWYRPSVPPVPQIRSLIYIQPAAGDRDGRRPIDATRLVRRAGLFPSPPRTSEVESPGVTTVE